MKRLLIAILIVSMVQGVFAQKIEIKGTIRNATDNEATEFVNVVLQTTDSVFVNGVLEITDWFFPVSDTTHNTSH